MCFVIVNESAAVTLFAWSPKIRTRQTHRHTESNLETSLCSFNTGHEGSKAYQNNQCGSVCTELLVRCQWPRLARPPDRTDRHTDTHNQIWRPHFISTSLAILGSSINENHHQNPECTDWRKINIGFYCFGFLDMWCNKD